MVKNINRSSGYYQVATTAQNGARLEAVYYWNGTMWLCEGYQVRPVAILRPLDGKPTIGGCSHPQSARAEVFCNLKCHLCGAKLITPRAGEAFA